MHHAREGVEFVGPRKADGDHPLDGLGTDRRERHARRSPGFGSGDYHVVGCAPLRGCKAAFHPQRRTSATALPLPEAGLSAPAAVAAEVAELSPAAGAGGEGGRPPPGGGGGGGGGGP